MPLEYICVDAMRTSSTFHQIIRYLPRRIIVPSIVFRHLHSLITTPLIFLLDDIVLLGIGQKRPCATGGLGRAGSGRKLVECGGSNFLR
jgi:hypothetical protein